MSSGSASSCARLGASPPALAARLAAKYGIDLSRYLADGRYLWHDFSSFIACYAAVANVFRSEEDFAALAEAYLSELAAADTIYAELFVSPEQGLAAGRSPRVPPGPAGAQRRRPGD